MNEGTIIRNTRAAQAPLIEGNMIKGYAIIWDSLNDYDEVALKGCCAKSLKERGVNAKGGNKIQFLAYHDPEKIMARLTRLEEDETGLYFEAELLDLDGTRDEVKRIREGLLRQMSYGFSYKPDGCNFDPQSGVLYLSDIDLYEISLVTFSSDARAQLRNRCAAMSREEAEKALRTMSAEPAAEPEPDPQPGVLRRLADLLN